MGRKCSLLIYIPPTEEGDLPKLSEGNGMKPRFPFHSSVAFFVGPESFHPDVRNVTVADI